MSTRIALTVPDLGEAHDVPLAEIMIAEGAMIALDDTVALAETDKTTLDIPANIAGRVLEVIVKPGQKVNSGDIIAYVEGVAAQEPPKVAPLVEATPPTVTAPPPKKAPNAPAVTYGDAIPHASPSMRKYARELGLDLAGVAGSGPKGRIVQNDILDAVKHRLARPMDKPPAAPQSEAKSASAFGLALPEWPKVDYAAFGEIERKPLSRIRRISGPSLARNAVVIPHVTSFDWADITDLEAFRQQVNAAGQGAKLSVLPFAMKACAAVLKALPEFNASLDGDAIILKRYIHIGFAADTPDGLVVPVVRDVDRKSISEIAGELSQLAADARAGKLKPTAMQGASFTISSLGGMGGGFFTPIINAPEVAILGIGRAEMQPVWDGSAFQPRLKMPLSLSWDHRVVDGVAAARFLTALKALLADLRRLAL